MVHIAYICLSDLLQKKITVIVKNTKNLLSQ